MVAAMQGELSVVVSHHARPPDGAPRGSRISVRRVDPDGDPMLAEHVGWEALCDEPCTMCEYPHPNLTASTRDLSFPLSLYLHPVFPFSLL